MNVSYPERDRDAERSAPSPSAPLWAPHQFVGTEVEITPDLIRLLAGFAGFSIAEADIDALTGAVAAQMRTAATLRSLDLTEVPPITIMDPRWT